MSAEASPVTDRHVKYIADHTRGDDTFLLELKRAAAKAGIPPIWVSPAQASFMQIQLKLARARDVLEVGTLAGYSAIAMARALPPQGRVRTIEINPEFAEFAERWAAKSEVAGRVEVLRGDAKQVLPRMEANSADAAFLDADKSGYPVYLKECLRIVRRGGLIMADNAFAFGELFAEHPQDRETPAIRVFNEIIAAETGLHAIIAPFGDGCWVAVKE